MNLNVYAVSGRSGQHDAEGYAVWKQHPVTAYSAKQAKEIFKAMYPVSWGGLQVRKLVSLK